MCEARRASAARAGDVEHQLKSTRPEAESFVSPKTSRVGRHGRRSRQDRNAHDRRGSADGSSERRQSITRPSLGLVIRVHEGCYGTSGISLKWDHTGGCRRAQKLPLAAAGPFQECGLREVARSGGGATARTPEVYRVRRSGSVDVPPGSLSRDAPGDAMTPQKNSTRPDPAVQAAERLQQQAARTSDLRLKRTLLAASCELIDRALRLHRPPEAA